MEKKNILKRQCKRTVKVETCLKAADNKCALMHTPRH